MDLWRVQFSEEASRNFAKLDNPTRLQVRDRIAWFAENIDHAQQAVLHYDLKKLFKLRAGDWRITYELNRVEKVIKISAIKHRSKIYRRRK